MSAYAEKYWPGVGTRALAYLLYGQIIPRAAVDPQTALDMFRMMLLTLPPEVCEAALAAMDEVERNGVDDGLEIYVKEGLIDEAERERYRAALLAKAMLVAGLSAVGPWLHDVLFPRSRREVLELEWDEEGEAAEEEGAEEEAQ